MFSFDKKKLEEKSNSNKEVDENSINSVIVVNDDTDSEFSIRSHIDNDDDDDDTTANKKGRACNDHRKFKKGFYNYYLVYRYLISLET